MNERAQKILRRLELALQRAHEQVREDPIPYLEAAQEELMNAGRLSPDVVFEWAQEHEVMATHPRDIQGEALIRCNAAQRILDEYLRGKDDG